ncbi:6971_t:CDS:1 [Ambispora leptoticha]|uniref:6971_t:CDS:1 n=1 Tax=Ambispora leptoticha TaxID=144679 RepID=A0A9N8V587_9GLOM|nr:6971_t:CDS:1 [Ambispora leptoticha]
MNKENSEVLKEKAKSDPTYIEDEGYISDNEENYTSTPSSEMIAPKKENDEGIVDNLDKLPPSVVQKIKDLENSVNNKDLEIKELKNTIQELKKEKKSINNQTQNLLSTDGLVKTKSSWRSKRDNVLKVLNDNFTPEEIKKEFGDIYKG